MQTHTVLKNGKKIRYKKERACEREEEENEKGEEGKERKEERGKECERERKKHLALTRSRKNSSHADLAKKEHFPFHQYKNTALT